MNLEEIATVVLAKENWESLHKRLTSEELLERIFGPKAKLSNEPEVRCGNCMYGPLTGVEELKEALREGKAPLKVGATKKENLKVV